VFQLMSRRWYNWIIWKLYGPAVWIPWIISMGEDSNFYIEERIRLIGKVDRLKVSLFVINDPGMDIVGHVLGNLQKDCQITSTGLSNQPRKKPIGSNWSSQPSMGTLEMVWCLQERSWSCKENSGDLLKKGLSKNRFKGIEQALYQIQVQINFETITKRLVKAISQIWFMS